MHENVDERAIKQLPTYVEKNKQQRYVYPLIDYIHLCTTTTNDSIHDGNSYEHETTNNRKTFSTKINLLFIFELDCISAVSLYCHDNVSNACACSCPYVFVFTAIINAMHWHYIYIKTMSWNRGNHNNMGGLKGQFHFISSGFFSLLYFDDSL